jgi:hypothetical protein
MNRADALEISPMLLKLVFYVGIPVVFTVMLFTALALFVNQQCGGFQYHFDFTTKSQQPDCG